MHTRADLGRVAEALFWTGRYVERAELTARILDVHLQATWLELPTHQDAADGPSVVV